MPSRGRALAATAPALLVFWNLPRAGARGRMGGEGEEKRGRGRGAAADTRSAPAAPRGKRAAAALPLPAEQGSQRENRRQRVAARPHAPPSLRARPRHLT